MKPILSYMSYYAAMLVIAAFCIVTIKRSSNFEVDAQTKKLCSWYAGLNHQGEISPNRWEWGHEWIAKYDWYGSCLKHVELPVAIRY